MSMQIAVLLQYLFHLLGVYIDGFSFLLEIFHDVHFRTALFNKIFFFCNICVASFSEKYELLRVFCMYLSFLTKLEIHIQAHITLKLNSNISEVCLHACTHTHTHIYMYLYVYIYQCKYLHGYTQTHIYKYIFIIIKHTHIHKCKAVYIQ